MPLDTIIRTRICACASARARAHSPLRGFYLVVTRERRVENRRTGTDSHVSCDSNIGRRMRYETRAFFFYQSIIRRLEITLFFPLIPLFS